MIALRLRDTTAGRADLRAEHPVIMEVASRTALERIRSRAAELGYEPTSGEHSDAAWVEVLDPDGIATRFAYPHAERRFFGIRFDGDGREVSYRVPRLAVD